MNHMTADSSNAPWWDDYEHTECPDCDGTGYIQDKDFDEMVPCKRCDGEGVI